VEFLGEIRNYTRIQYHGVGQLITNGMQANKIRSAAGAAVAAGVIINATTQNKH
jgi:hypothetical protein